MLKNANKLPQMLKTPQVQPYYEALKRRKISRFFKRSIDIFAAVVLIILLAVPMLIIAVMIKLDSKGPVVFKQLRVTKYGKTFKILKFRSMKTDAENAGPLVTVGEDTRITRVGKKLRKLRLDELPQIFHVLSGKMSLVGTRPEVPHYVEQYTPEMYATLLLPAGITSLASIMFKDEDDLLANVANPDDEYVNVVLPKKMKYNLEYIEQFSVGRDVKLLFKTVKDVIF
ncbi:MAG: sugar transferase [Oscillospiraceae bacterium]|nr:sugar transferase [Oscillospiraceae bacterium]